MGIQRLLYGGVDQYPIPNIDYPIVIRYAACDALKRATLVNERTLMVTVPNCTQSRAILRNAGERIKGWMLRLKQVELEREVEERQARLARVAARLRLIGQEGRMPTYEVTIKEVPAQRQHP